MSATLQAEMLKQRTTSTNVGLAIALAALVLFVVGFHGLILPVSALAVRSHQQMLFGWGTALATLFAALLGAMSVTGEIRYGTIRPTFLTTPDRARVIVAKVAASALGGALLGLIAEGLAAAAGSAALSARGIPMRFDGGDYALLLAGGAAAAGVCAAIGVAIGALVRNQVATLLGITAWLLLLEPLLLGYAPSVAKFAPGAAAGALAGATATVNSSKLVAPAIGAALLALYAIVMAAAGSAATSRRDVP
jgi:ABC-2 type transport system permease protein